jgi:hypothetical protein
MSNARKLADNLPTDGQLGNRNVLINGAMNVAQRSASVTGLGATTGYYTADRWEHQFNGTAGRLTSSVVGISDLAGFRSASKFACTTADTSIAADEYFVFAQKIEGFNIQSVGFGTASAKPLTLSFYAKGNGNAQYTAQLQTGGSNEVSASFNVTSSWQRFEISYPAATSVGSVLNNDNSAQLNLQIWLHAGSTFSGGTSLNTTWGSPANNTMAVGNSSFFSSTSNEFFITGLQLEAGPQSTPFEHEPYDTTLEKCQRYYQISGTGRTYGIVFNQFTATNAYANQRWWKLMRTAPTITMNSLSNYNIYNTGASRGKSAVGIGQLSDNSGEFYITTDSLTAGTATHLNTNGDAFCWKADAEL